ncbi:MAG: hypothetical protein J6W96_01965 [Alphaproteobacteria bacterium]|nr:hypothetical protein [Alphaproteobacteria bacterium]
MIKFNNLIYLVGFILGLFVVNSFCWVCPAYAEEPNTSLEQENSDEKQEAPKNKIDIKKSFSDNLSDTSSTEQSKKKDSETRETWLDSLISKGSIDIFKSKDKKVYKTEKKRIEKVIQKKRSNAANLDISGARLRMSPEETGKVLSENGYKRLVREENAPNFIKWRSEELCRINGVIGFERLTACTKEVAKSNGFNYITREIYNRETTHESIEVFYTSTFTNNLSYHIVYKSNIPFSNSKASQNVYINNLKIYDFWKRIDLRYGEPDNISEVKWGLGGRKPYLKATTGNLELVDPLLQDLDASRMLNEDSRLANTPYYTF